MKSVDTSSFLNNKDESVQHMKGLFDYYLDNRSSNRLSNLIAMRCGCPCILK